jgi:hypothetical protein
MQEGVGKDVEGVALFIGTGEHQMGQGIVGLKSPVVIALGIHGRDLHVLVEENDYKRVLLSVRVREKEGYRFGRGFCWAVGHFWIQAKTLPAALFFFSNSFLCFLSDFLL